MRTLVALLGRTIRLVRPINPSIGKPLHRCVSPLPRIGTATLQLVGATVLSVVPLPCSGATCVLLGGPHVRPGALLL